MKLSIAGASIAALCSLSVAQVSPEAEKLAAESAQKCQQTSSTKPTPQLIMEKVAAGCELIEQQGAKAFSKFKGKNSEFLFAGTYIWINDMNGKMLMHPIKPAMEGKQLMGLKDGNGKRFFVDMIAVASKDGDGWVDYTWPKPGETERSLKVSYVKKATCDGQDVILGCGAYDITLDDIKAATAE
jgi:methyl-accepting chemotaxis protein